MGAPAPSVDCLPAWANRSIFFRNYPFDHPAVAHAFLNSAYHVEWILRAASALSVLFYYAQQPSSQSPSLFISPFVLQQPPQSIVCLNVPMGESSLAIIHLTTLQ